MMLLHIIKRRRIGSNTDHHAVLLYLQNTAYSARVSDHHKARASTKFFSSLNNPTQNNRGRWHQMSEYSTTPQLFVKNGQGESRSDEDTKEQSSINHSNMSSHLDQQQEKKQHKVRKGGTDELDSNDPFNWAPTNFQRSILVLIGFYKSKDQIPALIPGRQYIRYNNRLRLLQFSFLTSFFVMMYITWHILMNNYFMSDAGKRDRFNRQRFEEMQFRQAEIEKSRGNE